MDAWARPAIGQEILSEAFLQDELTDAGGEHDVVVSDRSGQAFDVLRRTRLPSRRHEAAPGPSGPGALVGAVAQRAFSMPL